MIFTVVICALSVMLFIAYAVIRKRVLQNRMACISVADSPQVDEELILDMAEYKENISKLGILSAAICALTVISFFIL